MKLLLALAVFLATTSSAAACGVERWAVKTLTDPAASTVNYSQIVRTNIPKLDAIPSDQPRTREAPTETTVYQLTGTHIIEFKVEADQDIHLVLRSPLAGNPTMIAELPDPSCVTGSLQADRMGAVRAAFVAYVSAHGLALSSSFTHADITVTLQGVGFLDFNHGQSGVAPNAIELHPLLYFHAVP